MLNIARLRNKETDILCECEFNTYNFTEQTIYVYTVWISIYVQLNDENWERVDST